MSDRRGLGRGLAALIPTGDDEQEAPSLREVPTWAVRPNPRQPRSVIDDDELAQLAASIREVGVLQPVIVRETDPERYELIAGERRWRAAQLAGLSRIPAVVRHTDDRDLLREALIENIQRVDLNPLEEAAAYEQLLGDLGATHDELASRLGKSRPTVTNAIRLLALPPSVQRRIAAGVISAGHAKALLGLGDGGEQERMAERIVAEGLSVRSTEEAVRAGGAGTPTASRGGNGRRRVASSGLADLEQRLSDGLMARVRVSMGARSGQVSITFASVDDLERIVGVIAKGLQTPMELPEADLPRQAQPGSEAVT